jgi:hypothetical protein
MAAKYWKMEVVGWWLVNGGWKNRNFKLRILNYEFSFCLFFFAGMDIRLCNCSGSAFQAVMVVMSLSADRDLRL